MLTKQHKYKVFQEIFDGPNSKKLIEQKGLHQVEQYLLNESIIYFGSKYLEKINELIIADCTKSLTVEEIFDKNMIESVKNLILDTKKDTKKATITKYSSYQIEAMKFLEKNNSSNNIIVFPTGYGKTIVAFNEIKKQLKLGKKIVFCAPTNILVSQQYEEFISYSEDSLDEDIINNTSLEFSEDKNVFFLTNHKAELLIKEGVLDSNYFYVIDEIHEGEGKQNSEKESKYPTFTGFKDKNFHILGLSASPTNLDILRKNLKINNIFYGAKKEFFIPKNRELSFSKKDNNFLEIENIIISPLKDYYNYVEIFLKIALNDNLINDKDYNFIKDFLDKDIEKMIYLSGDYIKSFEQIFDRKNNGKFIDNLWKIKKLLELKKKLYENDYFYLLDYIKEQLLINLKIEREGLQSKKIRLQNEIKTQENEEEKIKDQDEIDKIEEKIKKSWKKYHIKINQNNWSFELYRKVLNNILINKKDKILHPKTKDLFDIIKNKSKKGKTIFVHIENESIIKEFVAYAINQGLKASYFIGGQKTKISKFIDSYTKEKIKKSSLDVVFITSVFKLGMNFDIDDLIFYHSPKNKKDLLQFEGRIGRYSGSANITYMGIEDGHEQNHSLATISKANIYLKNQFEQSENNEKDEENGTNSIYEKKEIIKRQAGEYNISEILDTQINKGNFLNTRLKLFEIIGIFKNKFGNYYLNLYFVDNTSNRGINILVNYTGKIKNEEKIIKILNDFANSLIKGRIYSINGIIKDIGGYDVIIETNINNPNKQIKLIEKNSFIEDEYNLKQAYGDTKIHKTYNKGRNCITNSLFTL